VFHFNKKHLEDQTIPMWVIKTRGKTYYVNHVSCSLSWTTKETPDNSHTKGSIKIKHCLLVIDDENNANISALEQHDKIRIRNAEHGITRIIWSNPSFERILREEHIKHSPFKRIYGECSTLFTVCDILKESDAIMLALKYTKQFRILSPNEAYYKAYDDAKQWAELQYKDDMDDYDDEE
jgi:hypothetical protein